MLEAVPGDLDVRILRSKDELVAARADAGDRRAFEEQLCAGLQGREEWTLPGVCQVCNEAVELFGDWLHSDGRTVNFRERLICPKCELNNRQRFMAQLLRGHLEESGAAGPVYLHEQVTPFFSWAERDLPVSVVGSEYLGHDLEGGAIVEGIRHEDALALTFDDAAFDVIVSNDVFEHVADVDRSLAECVRVLRPGGRLLFTIPFHSMSEETVKRAELSGGEVVHLLPAEYHGNPVSPGGSLVFYDHGWEILDACRRAGFGDAYLIGYWSVVYGYLGHGLQLMLVAER